MYHPDTTYKVAVLFVAIAVYAAEESAMIFVIAVALVTPVTILVTAVRSVEVTTTVPVLP
jgi:hypothetical protein